MVFEFDFMMTLFLCPKISGRNNLKHFGLFFDLEDDTSNVNSHREKFSRGNDILFY